jgi:hypothetical protein
MGIVEAELAAFETPSGQAYVVEYNENGSIHVHTGHVRLDMTPHEFEEFAAVVAAAREELESMKDGLEAE